MLPLLLVAFATSALAYDDYWTEYNADLPSGLEGATYQVRYLSNQSGNDSDWFDIPEDYGGLSLGGAYADDIVAYRLKDDDSSTVVYKYDGTVAPLNVTSVEGKYGASVFWIHSIRTTYASDDTSESKRDVWDEGTFSPLSFASPDSVISIINSECAETTVNFSLIDGNGNTTVVADNETLTDEDRIAVFVPETFPVTGNVTFSDGSALEFVLTGKERIFYALGSGNVPTVSASYDMQIQYCPD